MNPEGVGLGLVISNMLAKNLGPKFINTQQQGLQIESVFGEGTKFSFLLFD